MYNVLNIFQIHKGYHISLFSHSRILTVSTSQVELTLHLFHSMSRKITRIPKGVFTSRKSGTTDNKKVKRKTKQTTLDIKPIVEQRKRKIEQHELH